MKKVQLKIFLIGLVFMVGAISAPRASYAMNGLSAGVDFAYVPEAMTYWFTGLDHGAGPYTTGKDGVNQPALLFGLMAKYDMNFIGFRLGFNYLILSETEQSVGVTSPAVAQKTSGSGFILPFTICLNFVNTEKSQVYIGYGFGYTSIGVNIDNYSTTSGDTAEIKTSGIDFHVLIGGEAMVNQKLSLFAEVLLNRGSKIDSDLTVKAGGTSTDYKLAVNRSMTLAWLGVRYHL